MPAAILKGSVAACHVCKNRDVRVTTLGDLIRHMNTRGYVCKGSGQPRQNRVRRSA